MNQSEALQELRDGFREFLLLKYEAYFCFDFQGLIRLCDEVVDGEVNGYFQDIRHITRIDIVNDLAISLAIERFIERLTDWRERRDYKRRGMDNPHPLDFEQCGLVYWNQHYDFWYIDELDGVRRDAMRILNAIEKLRETNRTYSHPVLAYSDYLRKQNKAKWTRPAIARVYLMNLSPKEKANEIRKYGGNREAITSLAKYLENHRNELLYP